MKNALTYKVPKNEFQKQLDIWLSQHARACLYSLGQYAKNPLNNILTTAVIGISLALPTGFYLLLHNIHTISSGWDGASQITLFLKTEITDKQTEAFTTQLKQEIAGEITIIKRAEALAEYKTSSGTTATTLSVLDNENPLPNIISIKPDIENPDILQNLIQKLGTLPEIDSVHYDSKWIKRLFYLLDIINRIIIILTSLLAIAVLLVIGNTIRLSIYNQRSEIEIIKLFGGTDRFIQRPFLYNGLWYGAFGSVIAWLLITISLQTLQKSIQQLTELYNSDFQLLGLGLNNSFILLGTGIGLGWLGSWIAVKRHLKAIEPV